MEKHDLPRFVEFIQALAAAFNREADEALLLGYELGLRDVPIDAVEIGVQRALSDSQFMPTPRELRDLSGVLSLQGRAVIAWAAIEKAASQPYQSIYFDDAVTMAAIDNLGGWDRFTAEGMTREQFDVWLRKEFERVYVELGRSGRVRAPHHFAGLFEKDNRARGWCDAMGITHDLHGNEIARPLLIATGLPPLALPHYETATPALPAERPQIPTVLFERH